MKAIIVDDEPNCHDVLLHLLGRDHPEIEVIDQCFNVRQAIVSISARRPDLLFLDVEMPDGTGFDLLKELGDTRLMIIFITAYNKYAISAIHSGALDYLLKPLTAEPLTDAIMRVRKKSAETFQWEQIQNVLQSMQAFNAHQLPSRTMISTQEGYHIVPIRDIIRLEADGNFTEFFYLNAPKRLIAASKIKTFEEQFLPYPQFMRVHRSHLVNLEMVESYQRGDANLKMKDGSVVGVSRDNRDELLGRLREI